MRLAVISDIHVLGPGENERDREVRVELLTVRGRLRGSWGRFLHATRRRLWNWHPESRYDCFLKALAEMHDYDPDFVIANGDYAGDAEGVGLSNDATYESAAGVITLICEIFPDRCFFNFGDHDIGKYSTPLRRGGVRLASVQRGEDLLGIRSFWQQRVDEFELIGVNSSLIILDHFLPEALKEETPEWHRLRNAHLEAVRAAFAGLAPDARVILFCHDPSALGSLRAEPEVAARLNQIDLTVLGHLHEPRLLTLIQRMPHFRLWTPKYPVARIIATGLRDAKTWSVFNPIVCPSPFGAGHHLSGGILFIERTSTGHLLARRHRVKL